MPEELKKKKSKLKTKRVLRYVLFSVGSALSALVVSFLILL